jgi:amidase
MTRDVRDAAAMLGAIAGFHPGDPDSIRAPVPDYLAELEQGIAGVRIGIDERFCSDGMAPEVVERVLAKRAAFERCGAVFQSVTVPEIAPVLQAWNTIAPAEAAIAYATRPADHADAYGPALAQFLAQGSQSSDQDVARAQDARRRFAARLEELFQQIDLLLSPALGIAVPAREPLWLQDPAIQLDLLLQFTAPFNCSGNPAITLPAGFSSDGMPVGLQLVGRHREESLLLRAGQVFQNETAWQQHLPPVEGT